VQIKLQNERRKVRATMSCFVKKKDAEEIKGDYGHGTWRLLGEGNGCTKGCCTGISYYSSLDYTPPAVHDDQEGFLVLSGKGMARVGEEEFEIVPETSFIVPAGVEHQMKSACEDTPVTLFWFHAQA
jgi:mannose-6-phosphate isomerase-like protein (cupin superfamily)